MMDIVTCTDNKYVMPTGVMIYSACANNAQGSITFHIVIDESVTSDNQKKLEDTVTPFNNQICFYKVDSTPFKSFPALNNRKTITQATYYRLFLAEILPQSVDKVIYLDGDVIVRHSLAELWNVDMNGFAIAGAPISFGTVEDECVRLECPIEKGNFNAGVLLINLSYWRENNVLAMCVHFIMENSDKIVFHDQDVLNYVLRNNKTHLPIKFNFQSGFLYKKPTYSLQYWEEVEATKMNPFIIHYTGAKPWWVYNRHLHPYRGTFFKYKNKTIWKNEPLWEVRPLTIRIRKRIAVTMRRLGVLPELPSDGCELIKISPID